MDSLVHGSVQLDSDSIPKSTDGQHPFYSEEIDNQRSMRKFRRKQRSLSDQMKKRERPVRDKCVPGTSSTYKTVGGCPRNKNGNIKRPMNAFMVFGRTYRSSLMKMFPASSNSQISVYLGEIWHKMTSDQQKPYFDESNRIKYKHRRDYPGWVYRPSSRQEGYEGSFGSCQVDSPLPKLVLIGDQCQQIPQMTVVPIIYPMSNATLTFTVAADGTPLHYDNLESPAPSGIEFTTAAAANIVPGSENFPNGVGVQMCWDQLPTSENHPCELGWSDCDREIPDYSPVMAHHVPPWTNLGGMVPYSTTTLATMETMQGMEYSTEYMLNSVATTNGESYGPVLPSDEIQPDFPEYWSSPEQYIDASPLAYMDTIQELSSLSSLPTMGGMIQPIDSAPTPEEIFTEYLINPIEPVTEESYQTFLQSDELPPMLQNCTEQCIMGSSQTDMEPKDLDVLNQMKEEEELKDYSEASNFPHLDIGRWMSYLNQPEELDEQALELTF